MRQCRMIIAPSKIAGTGAYADKDYEKGEFIGEYLGKLITNKEADERYGDESATYLFSVEDDLCIDATHIDCPLKYINHSCDPNCYAEVDKHKVFYYAKHAIKKGEELTVDYQIEVDPSDDDPQTCFCGTKACRGTMKASEEI